MADTKPKMLPSRDWLMTEAKKAAKAGGIARAMGRNDPNTLKAFVGAVSEAEVQELQAARAKWKPTKGMTKQIKAAAKAEDQMLKGAQSAQEAAFALEKHRNMVEAFRAKKAEKFKRMAGHHVKHLKGPLRDKEFARILDGMVKANSPGELTEDELFGLELFRKVGMEHPNSIYGKIVEPTQEWLKARMPDVWDVTPADFDNLQGLARESLYGAVREKIPEEHRDDWDRAQGRSLEFLDALDEKSGFKGFRERWGQVEEQLAGREDGDVLDAMLGPSFMDYQMAPGDKLSETGPGIADDPNDVRNWSRKQYEDYQNREIAPARDMNREISPARDKPSYQFSNKPPRSGRK